MYPQSYGQSHSTTPASPNGPPPPQIPQPQQQQPQQVAPQNYYGTTPSTQQQQRPYENPGNEPTPAYGNPRPPSYGNNQFQRGQSYGGQNQAQSYDNGQFGGNRNQPQGNPPPLPPPFVPRHLQPCLPPRPRRKVKTKKCKGCLQLEPCAKGLPVKYRPPSRVLKYFKWTTPKCRSGKCARENLPYCCGTSVSADPNKGFSLPPANANSYGANPPSSLGRAPFTKIQPFGPQPNPGSFSGQGQGSDLRYDNPQQGPQEQQQQQEQGSLGMYPNYGQNQGQQLNPPGQPAYQQQMTQPYAGGGYGNGQTQNPGASYQNSQQYQNQPNSFSQQQQQPGYVKPSPQQYQGYPQR